MRRLTLVCLFLAATVVRAGACSFDGFVAPPTLVDRMMGAQRIVLARPDPVDPTRFAVVAVLAGGGPQAALPHLVDSVTGWRLAENPGDTVIFGQAGPFLPWQRFGTLDAGHRALVAHVAARLPDWRAGRTADRAALLASLATDPDSMVREMALGALDGLSYGALRALDPALDVPRLLARLDVMSERHRLALRILLLGLSGEPQVRAVIVAGLSDRALTPAETGAHAAALIEIDGAAAVARLSRLVADPASPPGQRAGILRAMAVHARAGSAPVQAAIRRHMPAALTANRGFVPARGGRSG